MLTATQLIVLVRVFVVCLSISICVDHEAVARKGSTRNRQKEKRDRITIKKRQVVRTTLLLLHWLGSSF